MREPSLNETDAPPRRRSLTLATPQKSFLCISDFARAGFFLLKGKQIFFVVFCSERAGGGAFRTSLGRLGIPPPNPLLPSRPRTRGQVFCLRGGYNLYIMEDFGKHDHHHHDQDRAGHWTAPHLLQKMTVPRVAY